MLELAWHSVRRQPRRLAASAGATAGSVMLVLVAAGLYLGLLDAVVRWPRSLPGDLVVSEAAGSATVLHASSTLTADAVAAVQAVAGVRAVHPLHGRLVWLERDGRQALVFLAAVDRRGTFGGPETLLVGHRVPDIDEIVVDRVLAHDLRVAPGDSLRVGDAALRVAGVADGGNAVLGSYAFASLGTMRAAGLVQPAFLFVEATDPDAVAARIAAIAGLRVTTRAAFLAQNQALARQLLLPLIAIVAGLAAVVGGAIVALVLYTATVERRADWGLLSAIGVPATRLRRTVLAQAAIAVAVGSVAGIAGGRALAYAIPAVEPRFVAQMPPWLDVGVAGLALAVGLAAAVVPVRAVTRTDPALVFRV